jgi:1-acyl-sn-glycerol-3-phosphate acyltransferase
MLLALPIIMIAALFGVKGGNFIYKILLFWARLWYIFLGICHKEIYEAPHVKNQQYIFIGNHISYMDIPPVMSSIHQPFRVLGKYEMVKMPIFGLIYKATVILVDRRDSEKRAKSVRALKSALANGISVFIFPEGTFNETQKPLIPFFDGAFRIAIETQTNIKPLLFVDTLERLHYKSIFSLTPGKNRTIYLQEVSVKGLTMKDLPKLKQAVYTQMEQCLMKYRNYDS